MSTQEQQNSINKPLLTVGDGDAVVAVKPTIKNNRSLVSRSGKQFESVDHYIAESIVQNYYPRNNNQQDLQLIENSNDESNNISPMQQSDDETSKKKSCFHMKI